MNDGPSDSLLAVVLRLEDGVSGGVRRACVFRLFLRPLVLCGTPPVLVAYFACRGAVSLVLRGFWWVGGIGDGRSGDLNKNERRNRKRNGALHELNVLAGDWGVRERANSWLLSSVNLEIIAR